MNAAVFLDRDNTLIHNDGDLGDPDQVRLIQGVPSAIASLRGLGYRIVVVSNQGAVARGVCSEADVEKVNQRINDQIRATSGATIDRFYFCPYHPKGTVEKYRREHPWRKPQPGMILQAATDMGLDLSQSWMIGDQLRDVQAGIAAGVRSILIRPHKTGDSPTAGSPTALSQSNDPTHEAESSDEVGPHFVARNLIEAVRIVAQQLRPEMLDAGLAEVAGRARKPSPTPSQLPPEQPASTSPNSAVNVIPDSVSLPPQAGAAARETAPAAALVQPIPAGTSKRGFRPLDAPSYAQQAEVPLANVLRKEGEHFEANRTATAETVEATPAQTVPEIEENRAVSPREDATLRQILQELRLLRNSREGDFNYWTMAAVVLQLVAVICLLGGLWMGGEELNTFLRWLGCGLFAQLTVMTVLLLDRRGG